MYNIPNTTLPYNASNAVLDPTKIKTISFRNTSKGSGLTSTCAPLLIPTTFTS